ncbi:ParB N-terminal domain-containing protein [Acidaminobacter sp. JC074]|uniref:ParB N-terminal domain-containing protein n=1 Tax=Acidaminobacter sp. JC074 TaxID=2530199 RepID=UPI001F0D74D1
MKLDSPRRKITDAVDLFGFDENNSTIPDIEINLIQEFRDHPFHSYEGRRLDDMVESIKNNGVLNPVIIRPIGPGQYEMLAGHNRMNAATIAGLKTVPSIIKEDLTDEEAYIYVIETNLMQRSFNDMYPSEQAAVLEVQYKNVISQGRRTDIQNEIKMLENNDVQSSEKTSTNNRENVGNEHDMSSSSVARTLRLNKLIGEWKEAVDYKKVKKLVGVSLSYLPKKLQKHLYRECEDLSKKLSLNEANELKKLHRSGQLNETEISKFLIDVEKKKMKPKAYQKVKVSSQIITKYFKDNTPNEVEEIIEKALVKYFKN